MNNEKYEPEKTGEENELDQIPTHREFNLYVILICGLIISLIGVYEKIFSRDKEPSLYFDGESFHIGVIDGMFFIITGLIICIYPAYHLYKGNHKSKRNS